MAFKPITKSTEKLSTRHYSKNQETQVADKLGGVRTPNSGATPWIKGDVLTDQFIIECKTKTSPSQSISIKKEWFTKNKEDSLLVDKEHQAIVFNFGPDEENHYIIDEYLFQYLLECLERDKEKDENI